NRQTVALHLDNVVLDIGQFETAADPELYRGDFLEGFFLRDAPEFEQWQLSQRARLRDLALRRFAGRLQAALDGRQHDLATALARKLLAIEPWHEAAHRALMLTLARMGQRGAALAQFARCQQLLDEELAAPVTAATEALYNRIQALTGPRDNLPADSSRFVGRAAELEQIEARLTTATTRLLTLAGPGGSGKTRLALAAARARFDSYLEGVWFIDLVEQTAQDSLARLIAATLGLALEPNRPVQEQLLTWLADKELLLLLDNFETMSGQAALVGQIVQAAPAVAIIATSRVRLNLSSEQLMQVDGLSLTAGDELESDA
ncbi:MAG: AAA family ATPase, partial [Anaerolineales bacterium]|nr:AAA family ATPase [Anaerolineales bacterium]